MDTPPVNPTPRRESNTTVFSLDPRSERHPGIHMPPPPLVDTPQRHSGTLEQRTDDVELMFPQHLEVPVEIGREDNDNGQQSREHRNRSDEGHKSLSLPHKRAKRFFTNWVQSTVEPTEDNDDAGSRLSNTWYRYVHQTARRLGKNDCYVCSVIPMSAEQATLYGKPMSIQQARCFASLAGLGYQFPHIPADGRNSRGEWERVGWYNGSCDLDFWVNLNLTVKGKTRPQQVILEKNTTHPICYQQGYGSIPMGQIPSAKCGFTNRGRGGSPVAFYEPSNGTYVVEGGWWLCGKNTHLTLPANWTGRCAPIFVSDHTVFLSPEPKALKPNFRAKRAFKVKAHDSVWGTDVPAEFKHWSTGEKVLLALFPQVGVVKNMLRLETVDYRFGLFINSSLEVNRMQNREIDSIRTEVLYHRIVLDLLTASVGGTCILLNTTCCTYITDEVHSLNMTNAMGRLIDLQQAMTEDRKSKAEGAWWQWLGVGSIAQTLAKGAILLLAVLVSLGVIMCCIFPCIRGIIEKLISETFVSYTLLMHEEEKGDPYEGVKQEPL